MLLYCCTGGNMAKRIKFCPKCMNIIHKNDEKCSVCGLLVSEMQQKEIEKIEKQEKLFEQAKEDLSKQIAEENSIEENEGSVENTEQNFGSQENQNSENSNTPAPKRHRHKKKKQRVEDTPQYTVDEDGNFNIDTKDVTFLEGMETPTYSVKKARGDAPVIEKLKWWEIYKWADRMLAKRKIMKEVNKASRKIPYGINKVSMIILCLLFGWMGAHDFYAKNNKKGWTILSFDIVVGIVLSVPVLYKIMGVFVGGGLAFFVLFIWIFDFIDLLMNRYKYRISKEEFISNLNVKTRAKLGKRYIALDKTVFKAKEEKRIEKLNKKKQKKSKHKKEKINDGK